MKKRITKVLLLFTLIFLLSYCKDEVGEEFMDWEIVSLSDTDDIKVTIQNRISGTIFNSSAIYVNANYKEGDVVLRCTNHDIDSACLGPENRYTNSEIDFTLSSIDSNTLILHFNRNASGQREKSDQITVTNSDGKTVNNSFIFINRTFGELVPID